MPDQTPAEQLHAADYPQRHKVKGGRNVHATRLTAVHGIGHHMTACGLRATGEIARRESPVTCPKCHKALGSPS